MEWRLRSLEAAPRGTPPGRLPRPPRIRGATAPPTPRVAARAPTQRLAERTRRVPLPRQIALPGLKIICRLARCPIPRAVIPGVGLAAILRLTRARARINRRLPLVFTSTTSARQPACLG